MLTSFFNVILGSQLIIWPCGHRPGHKLKELLQIIFRPFSMQHNIQRIFLLSILWLVIQNANANVQLAKVFGDHMVIQRNQDIVVWGWGSPKEKIVVSFKSQKKATTVDKNGNWKITLLPEPEGGPFQLVVKGKNSITLSDILIGDVWLCSGQSNMEWSVANSNDANNEIKLANYPTIRHIDIPNTVAMSPQKDITGGEWKVCNPNTVGEFTAVGYFFARSLVKELNVPIGLINSTWGGTISETWTSKDGLAQSDEFKDCIANIPKLSLDSLTKLKASEIMNKVNLLQDVLPKDSAEAFNWKDQVYDASSWRTMKIPLAWELQELGDVDGFVWIRKTFELKNDPTGKPATLHLSMIDDSDITYLNGVKVGGLNQKWNEQRSYTIPSGVLKSGMNIIAVRIEDTGGAGGILGDANDVNLQIGNEVLPLSGYWSYRVESIRKETSAVGPNSYPTLLFNGMINPIIPFRIKGVIWYQGESNSTRAYQYRKAFPLLITDWRKHWGTGDFPFYFVQLSSYNENNGNSINGSTWAELREAQALTLSLPNTGMAVTTDIGNPYDIHPLNKQDVGKRLAALALNRTYNQKVLDSGPTFKSMEITDGRAVIHFNNVGNGLAGHDRYGYVKGFEIAGEDRQFRFAKASIEGNHVIVYNDEVSKPVAVRFGWADDASDCNLFNKEGFPAVPFRTDQWKALTETVKFSFK